MKFKFNAKNKRIIDWKGYKNELESKKTDISINEYERDLHTMRVKEGSYEKCFNNGKYRDILNDMSTFESTNLDYFKYEKELTLGEFNS